MMLMAAGAGMMPNKKKPKNKTWVAGGDNKAEGSTDNPE